MITLTQANIKALDHLGYGTFANVYRDGNNAYKIYKPKVNSNIGQVNNPCLTCFSPSRHRLIKKGKLLRYTDTIDDEIEVDRRFGGVKYKYQEGVVLSHIYINMPYFQKRDLALKLIRNNAELLEHHIYPQDYKMNNIVCDEDNEPHFIDLDDVLTKVTILPSRTYHNESLYGLKQLIMTMFNDASLNLLTPPTRELLDSFQMYNDLYHKHKTTVNDINAYLVSKEEPREYLFIDIERAITMVDFIKRMVTEKGVKVVLLINKFEFNPSDRYFKLTEELKRQGINVYDILTLGFDYTIENYTEASHTTGYYTHDKVLTYTKSML